MCCRDYHATIFAAIFSIVQSSFHLGFCIWGSNFYLCKYSIQTGTFRYLFYLTYFYTSNCTNLSLSDLPFEGTTILPIDENVEQTSTIETTDLNKEKINETLPNLVFPTESWVAVRTFNIMNGFIIVDSLWLITAIALLIGVCYQVKECLSMIFYFPWICILLVILFFDSIAAILFGIDVSLTYDFKNWFQFIGGANQEGVNEFSKRYLGPFTSFPSIIMIIIFSRFFIIWFINLFLLFRITQAAINAFDDFDDESSNISSKANNVDVVTSISVDNTICSRNFQVRHINPILLDIRRRRSQIQYASDDDDDIQTVRKHKKKIYKKSIDQIPSCLNFETNKEIKKLSDLSKQEQVSDDKHLKVFVGYEGDRSSSPSPVYNSKQTFNFSANYTSSYIIQISKALPKQ